MKRNTKGFYTLEAAVFLPLVILAVLSLGYFLKVEGTWENCIHGAVDECSFAAARSYDRTFTDISGKIEKRIINDEPGIEYVKVNSRIAADMISGDSRVRAYGIQVQMNLRLPLGFDRQFTLDTGIKYREFAGKKTEAAAMGKEALERAQSSEPVYVFPCSGEKYHGENCTYVKASVEKSILDSSLKKRYSPCSLCSSENLPAGSIVFCFKSENSAYHKGSCRTIKRHTVIIDRTEAEKKGYSVCSKCGGR